MADVVVGYYFGRIAGEVQANKAEAVAESARSAHAHCPGFW